MCTFKPNPSVAQLFMWQTVMWSCSAAKCIWSGMRCTSTQWAVVGRGVTMECNPGCPVLKSCSLQFPVAAVKTPLLHVPPARPTPLV